MSNRLATEKSPYLLQHADNPVDWFPWGDEAFAEASRSDRPVFLSIGYSTCHWCHVMEQESFENGEVAAILNRDFVSIKVDREERPDVDRVYMTYVQSATGTGGWPLSVWLTPALEPFYGGTYFPPVSRLGRPGFVDVLNEISRVWRDERERVLVAASAITSRLRAREGVTGAPAALPPDLLARGVEDLQRTFDSRHGGFGAAPKFPRPSELLLLFREHARTGRPEARDMALSTLRAIARGGIRDHLGGGFHRYAVDAAWRVPHFEKMLYDQAQLVLAGVDALQITREETFARVIEDTLTYVGRDMTTPSGAFCSAEDADSLPAGDSGAVRKREGVFYLWRAVEVDALLGHDAPLFRLRYGLEPGGNMRSDPHGEFQGLNQLYEARSVDEVASLTGRSPAEAAQALARSRQALFEVRARRPRPHLDDKVLTAWNGLMIAAFARSARALGEQRYYASAARAATFLRATLWDPATHRLLRRFRDGEAAIDAFAEDYACLIFGLIELFQAGGDSAWLSWALTLQRAQDALFWDEPSGGWFSTTGSDASLLLRHKEDYDGAEPSASAVGVWNLLALAHLTGDRAMFSHAEQTFRQFSSHLTHASRALPMLLAALSLQTGGLRQVVIVGPAGRSDTLALHAALHSRFLPFTLCIPLDPHNQKALAALLPFVGAMVMRHARATAYVCRDFACRAPTTDPEEMLAQVG